MTSKGVAVRCSETCCCDTLVGHVPRRSWTEAAKEQQFERAHQSNAQVTRLHAYIFKCGQSAAVSDLATERRARVERVVAGVPLVASGSESE